MGPDARPPPGAAAAAEAGAFFAGVDPGRRRRGGPGHQRRRAAGADRSRRDPPARGRGHPVPPARVRRRGAASRRSRARSASTSSAAACSSSGAAWSFDRGDLKLVPDPAEHDPVDVVLRTSILRLVRLVSGERNAGLEYLSGKLDIDGDADLALAVGGLFRVPGTGDVAVDPTALDPVDVATALKGAKTDHLRKVMASGFRGDRARRDLPAPARLRERPQGQGSATCLSGSGCWATPTGEVERYVVRVARRGRHRDPAEAGDDATATPSRDATVTCEALRLPEAGHRSPQCHNRSAARAVEGPR